MQQSEHLCCTLITEPGDSSRDPLDAGDQDNPKPPSVGLECSRDGIESCGIQSWRRSLWIFEHLRPSKTRQRSCICIRPSWPDIDLGNEHWMAHSFRALFSECQQGTLITLVVKLEIDRSDRCRLGLPRLLRCLSCGQENKLKDQSRSTAPLHVTMAMSW